MTFQMIIDLWLNYLLRPLEIGPCNGFVLCLFIPFIVFKIWLAISFNFQNNIGPEISLTDLIHFKQVVKEKVTYFIGVFKNL